MPQNEEGFSSIERRMDLIQRDISEMRRHNRRRIYLILLRYRQVQEEIGRIRTRRDKEMEESHVEEKRG